MYLLTTGTAAVAPYQPAYHDLKYVLRQLFYPTTVSNPHPVGVINLQNFEVQ